MPNLLIFLTCHDIYEWRMAVADRKYTAIRFRIAMTGGVSRARYITGAAPSRVTMMPQAALKSTCRWPYIEIIVSSAEVATEGGAEMMMLAGIMSRLIAQ